MFLPSIYLLQFRCWCDSSQRCACSNDVTGLTASNSSCLCMWCWMNVTLWIAFSSSNGYFFLTAMSLMLSSSPTMDGSPLYPEPPRAPIRPLNLLQNKVINNGKNLNLFKQVRSLPIPVDDCWSPTSPGGVNEEEQVRQYLIRRIRSQQRTREETPEEALPLSTIVEIIKLQNTLEIVLAKSRSAISRLKSNSKNTNIEKVNKG